VAVKRWHVGLGLSLSILILPLIVYHGARGHYRLDGEEELIWGNPAVADGRLVDVVQGRWQAGEYRPQVRPVSTLVRCVEHALYGYDRGRYQMDQVILHGICGLLVFFLLRRWLRSVAAGWLAALLFVVHPGASQSVLYLGGLSEMLCTIFSLGCLLSLRLEDPSPRRSWLAAGVLAFLAMLSKEAGFLLPLVAVGLIGTARPTWSQGKKLYGALALATLGALAYRFVALATLPEAATRIPAVDPTTGTPLYPLIVQSFAGLAVEVGVLALPLRLTHDYSWLFGVRGWPLFALGTIGVVLVGGLFWLAGRKRGSPPWSVLALLAVLPLVACAVLPRLCGTVASERNLYMALPGWCGLLLLSGQAMAPRRAGLAPMLAGAAVGIAVLLGVRTLVRVPDFADQGRLLRSAQRSHPHNPQILFELGNEKLVARDFKGAVSLYEEALKIRPDFPLAEMNLGTAYLGEEELGLSLRTLDPLVVRVKHVRALRMVDAKAHYHAGLVLVRQERFREAAEAFERTLLFYPDHRGAQGNLGFIYIRAPAYAERGVALLKRVLSEETDPHLRTNLEKGLNKAQGLLNDYVQRHGALPSQAEPAERGPLGEPWKTALAEGM